MATDDGPITITDAAKRIRSGELTPSSLLEICLTRIDRYEPKVKAWFYIDRERARREAELLTKELKDGLDRGPLHGVPIGIKDIIDVFDMPTGCGSKLWANSYARKDATCVERLRQAGALILGKTVTTAYAYLDPPVTRNPWNLERTPGGSSSGSAAAVACGLCLGALGTQTGGSITRPAAYCGVCALKPTYGRVSVDGVLPLAPSLDHVGVMANCVRDLAILFEAVAGTDGESGLAKAIPASVRLVDQRVSETCKEPPPKFTRLYGMFHELAEPSMKSAIEELCFNLKNLASTQASVTNAVPPAGFAELLRHHKTLMAVEAANYHATRFESRPEEYPPNISSLIAEGLSIPAFMYREARLKRDSLEIEMDGPATWSGKFLTPASTSAAPTNLTTGNPALNAPWSFTGLPTVSLPFAQDNDGLPLAVQLTDMSEHDGWLLAAAAWVERVVSRAHSLPPVP